VRLELINTLTALAKTDINAERSTLFAPIFAPILKAGTPAP
jgi:hypothetical protein